MSTGKKLLLWIPVAAYIAFIFWVSSAPRPIPGIQRFPWLDKPCHLLEYLPLGSLLVRAITGSFGGFARAAVNGWAFGGAFTVGTLDEFYQRFVPFKAASPWDTLFDCIGAAIGIWLYGRKRARTP